MNSSSVVIIPARNEAASVTAVIEEISGLLNIPVILIDDASTDKTAEVAKAAGATVIPLSVRLGAWGATQAGIRFALRNGYEIGITMDADQQHEASYVPELIKPVAAGLVDVSIGAFTCRGSKMRKIAWFLLKAVSGLSPEDITSGFRVYNRAAMELLAGKNASLLEYQDVGVLALLKREGLSIQEVPVIMRPRMSGHSRVFNTWLTVIYYMAYSLILGACKRHKG